MPTDAVTPAARALAALDQMAVTAGEGPLVARAILALARAAVARAEAYEAYEALAKARAYGKADSAHNAYAKLDDAFDAAVAALIAELSGGREV